MDRVIRILDSHAEAAAADVAELRAMTPQQRLDRALDLIAACKEARGEAGIPFEKVARVVQLEPPHNAFQCTSVREPTP